MRAGELPFSCVICQDGEIVVETTNRVVRDADVTRHAEIIAISEAQRVLGRKDLSDCTLYSNVEPCPMCSFPIRETRIGRVVYSISSPMMGGLSKWGVLSDREISDVMPQVFGRAPDISARADVSRGGCDVAELESAVLVRHPPEGLPRRIQQRRDGGVADPAGQENLLKRLALACPRPCRASAADRPRSLPQVAARQPQAKIAG